MFSSGHDMGSQVSVEEMATHQSWQENGGTREGAERLMLQEWHHFFENTRRWRNLRKITIAQVHGPVFSRSEEHTSELQSLMRISYAVFCLKKKNTKTTHNITHNERKAHNKPTKIHKEHK